MPKYNKRVYTLRIYANEPTNDLEFALECSPDSIEMLAKYTAMRQGNTGQLAEIIYCGQTISTFVIQE